MADVRELLSVPAGTEQAAYERAGYVSMLQAANRGGGYW